MRRVRRQLGVGILCAGLAAQPSCAHRQQLTNQDVAIGVTVAVGVALLIWLAVDQCHKGANYCDNSPR